MKNRMRNGPNSQMLKGGEFYGRVPQQRSVSSSILSEVIHSELLIPKHVHANPYFSLILEGGYSEKLGNKAQIHNPMSILWRREGILHKEDRIGAAGAHFFTVEVQPKHLTDLSQIADIPEDFCEQDSKLVQLICRLYHEFKTWQICSDLVAEGIILEMLAFAVRKDIYREKQPPVWLLRVTEKLNDEFMENISNEELAREAGVHPVHMAAVFRQFYHKTVSEYVQDQRINRAFNLLWDKKLSLAEIGSLTGFADQSHFTRVFKRIVGVAPGAFRSSLR
jgi:AraC family transcriptional regulator